MKFHSRFKKPILAFQKCKTIRDEQQETVGKNFDITTIRGEKYAIAYLVSAESCVITENSVETATAAYKTDSDLAEISRLLGFSSFVELKNYYTNEQGKKLPYVGVMHSFILTGEYHETETL